MRLPPLNALRAFESSGRTLSFTRAADELGVTPGAVRRQIKVLEEYLGARLFFRLNREVSLTPTGADYLDCLSDIFARIALATERIVTVPEQIPLRVATSATFLLRWLTPRLSSYYAAHPTQQMQFTVDLQPVDFLKSVLDTAIVLGQRDPPHAVSRTLFRIDLVTVCSPRLLADGRLQAIDDLNGVTLLHSSARPRNWEMWLTAAGRPDIRGVNAITFDSSSLAYQAAIEGVGVAAAQLPFVLDDLRRGTLVIPFPLAVRDEDEFNMVWPDRRPRNPAFLDFKDWLIAQAAVTAREIEEQLDVIAGRRSGD